MENTNLAKNIEIQVGNNSEHLCCKIEKSIEVIKKKIANREISIKEGEYIIQVLEDLAGK